MVALQFANVLAFISIDLTISFVIVVYFNRVFLRLLPKINNINKTNYK